MTGWPARLIALALLAAPGAAAAEDLQGLFPDAAGPPVLDRSVAVRLGGGRTVRLASVRFAPAPGRSEAVNTTWCGLVVQAAGRADQGVVVIGAGPTEALSCDGLKDAGPLPPSGGSPRIGLVYKTSSPNAAGLTPSVLVWERASGQWRQDERATDRLSGLAGAPTLDRMRAALSHG